jgi:hypothetical protein
MSLAFGAVAGRCSAAAVGQSKRAGQGVGRNLETVQEGVLALTQASGSIAFGVYQSGMRVILHTANHTFQSCNVLGNLRNLIPPRSSVSTQGYKPGAEVLKVNPDCLFARLPISVAEWAQIAVGNWQYRIAN